MANVFKPANWLRQTSNEQMTPPTTSSREPATAKSGVLTLDRPVAVSVEDVPIPVSTGSLQEQIGVRAYHKWHSEGCPTGRDVDFWLQAEREILEEIQAGKNI